MNFSAEQHQSGFCFGLSPNVLGGLHLPFVKGGREGFNRAVS